MTEAHDGLKVGSVIAGAGKPWLQQHMINNSENKDITEWIKVGDLPEPLSNSQAIITKNKVYLLGGHTGYSLVNTVYTANIDNDGNIGEWTKANSLPGPLYNPQAVVANNRVYLLNGHIRCAGGDVVFTAHIDKDGNIGGWSKSDTLPEPLFQSQAFVIRDRIYLLGGYRVDNFSNKVYTALVNKDGTLGRWEESNPLPGPLSNSQLVVTKNRVYLMGGNTDCINVASTVYTADIESDGSIGKWTISDPLPKALSSFQTVVTSNKVYLLGGYEYNGKKDVGGILDTVYMADVNEDGSLGKWITGSPLPEPLFASQAVITKNYIYLLGGYGLEEYSTSIYRANFSGGLNDYSQYYSSSK